MVYSEGRRSFMAEATRWGKDSVIIRHRLEKLPPNPEIDSPARERASVRNPLPYPSSPSRTYQFFFPPTVGKRKGGESPRSRPFFLARSQDPSRRCRRITEIMYRYRNKGMIGYIEADIFIGNP